MAQYSENRIDKRCILALAFLFFLFNFSIHFPGQMTPDSNNQYSEALLDSFSDMHPPVMAYLWSYLIHIADAAPAMLTFHLLFHWLGLCLISLGLLKIEKRWLALLVLLLGFFPALMYHNGFLHKDIGMASAFVTAFGLMFYFKIENKRVPVIFYLASLFLLTYGFLVRANGIFALGPLLIYMYLSPVWQKKIIRPLVCSILISAIALPLSQIINKDVLNARSLESTYSLFLFDIVGIANNADDMQVLPKSINISKQDLIQCYTPFWWDPFSDWGTCSASTQNLGAGNKVTHDELANRRELKDLWIKAIMLHPVAYLEHRLKVFNSELYFLVPAYHCQYASGCGVGQDISRAIKFDYIKNNFFFWPVFWLALGGMVFIMQSKESEATNDKQLIASQMLLLSGVLYLGALFLIGIATVNRYAYWPILAILLGLVLGYEQVKRLYYKNNRQFITGLVFVGSVVLAGLLARILNFTYLVT